MRAAQDEILVPASIFIVDGRIVAFLPPDVATTAGRATDGHRTIALPDLIDAHVHTCQLVTNAGGGFWAALASAASTVFDRLRCTHTDDLSTSPPIAGIGVFRVDCQSARLLKCQGDLLTDGVATVTDDPTIATYDRIAPAFADRTYGIDLDPARETFSQRIRLNAPAERFRILDAGCGPGRDCKWFFDRGFRVSGVDLSPGMLAEARRRVPDVEFRIADLRQLDFPDGHFDGIWCCASLLHLPLSDWPGVLASFNQLLGHGYLYLSVKQGEGEEVLESSYAPGTPRHFTYIRRPELELLLERAGFDVCEVGEGTRTPKSPHPWMNILAQTKLRTPLLSAIAYIFDDDGRLLLSERVDGRGWNPPCGFVDRQEAPNEAIHREVREETGLEIEVDRFIGVYTGPRTYRGVVNESHLALHAFTARWVGGTLTPTNEALQHGWFAPNQLPSPMASIHHVEILQDVLAIRAGQIPAPIVRRYRIARWSDLPPSQKL